MAAQSKQETPSMPTAVAATPAEEQQVGLAAKEPPSKELAARVGTSGEGFQIHDYCRFQYTDP